jgi:hypothetical protein
MILYNLNKYLVVFTIHLVRRTQLSMMYIVNQHTIVTNACVENLRLCPDICINQTFSALDFPFSSNTSFMIAVLIA